MAIVFTTVAQTVRAQPAVPVVALPAASATTLQKLGLIFGVRELANGKLLVDDAGNRVLQLFDSTLATATVVLDSAIGAVNKYGARPAPLIPYLGDSTLIPDYASLALLVIDGDGRVVRSMALPTPTDVRFMRPGTSVDNLGRLIYMGEAATIRSAVADSPDQRSDSAPLLRTDLESRRTDTIAYISRPLAQTRAASPDGQAVVAIWTVDPLRTLDEWSVLANGSVAIVRGQDYHIDWIRSDGASRSTPKLPFDWRRLSDDDKVRVIDSVRVQLGAAMGNGTLAARAEMITITRGSAEGGNGVPAGTPPARTASPPARSGPGFQGFSLLPDSPDRRDKIADYYPPVRTGGAIADGDGNVWILPTTSKQSVRGELVYDVVNSTGELVRRVRAPLGRLIVGFGKGGTVYMTSGSIANGFHIERSRLSLRESPSKHSRS